VPRYVAFLRAINVGGHVVKMEALRDLFATAGLKNVETFIASGNVIFETKAAPDEKLEQKIEKVLEKTLGYEVGAFVRSIEEIHAISVYQPFSPEDMKTATVVNVGFLHKAAAEDQIKPYETEVDAFHAHGREAYWLCRIRQNESKVPFKKFEKSIGSSSTWRNMNTIVRLAAKYSC
jgi:uncharacterized protein (DUF1697 family)